MLRGVCLARLRPIFTIEADRVLHQFSNISEYLGGCSKIILRRVIYFLVFFVLSCGLLGVFIASASGDASLRDPEVVVSASRILGNQTLLPASSRVVLREEIINSGATNAVDLLRHIPGLHIDNPGGLGGVSSIYLRGAEPNYTQVLIDGVPVNDPTNSRGGSFDLSTIDLSGIERVEILRGPQSAKYGSDAMAGIINFVSKRGNDTLAYSIFSRMTINGGDAKSLAMRGPIYDKGHVSSTISQTDEGQVLRDSKFTNTAATFNLDWNVADEDELAIAIRASESEGRAFPDDSGGPRFAKLRSADTRHVTEISTKLSYFSDPSEVSAYRASGSIYRRREVFDSVGVAPGIRSVAGVPSNSSETTFDRIDLYLSGAFEWPPKLTTIVGADFKREAGVSNGRLFFGGIPLDNRFVLRRGTMGWFGETHWEVRPTWFINGSARVDNPDAQKTVKSFSLGSTYKVVPSKTAIKVLWGQGFKLPSLYALGNELVGDPSLRSEESESVEFSVIQSVLDGRLDIETSMFYNRYKNTIDFDSTLNTLVNRSKISAWGGEVAVDGTFSQRLSLGSYVSYAKTDIKGSAQRLKNRAEWKGGLRAQWAVGRFFLWNMSLMHVGKILASSIPTGDQFIPSYNVVDVTGTWNPISDWRFSISVDNLFDADIDEAIGFAAPGLTVFVSVRYGL